MQNVQFAVVGAGAGGIAAAAAIARLGGQVLLLERRRHTGGRSVEAMPQSTPVDDGAGGGLYLALGAEVLGIFEDGILAYARAGRAHLVRAERIVLATGGEHMPLAFPGWQSQRVLTLDALLDRLDAHDVPSPLALFARGPELTAILPRLRASGVILAFTASPSGESADLQNVESGFAPVACVETRAGLEITMQRDGERRTVTAAALAVSGGTVERDELARQAGCALVFDEQRGDFRVQRSDTLHTSRDGIYSVPGDESRERAAALGLLAGTAAFFDLFPHTLMPAEDLLADAQARLQAQAAQDLAPLAAWTELPDVICPCEDVRLERSQTAGDLSDMNRWKRVTRAGTGLCQGRLCRRVVARLMAEQQGLPLSAVQPWSARAPVVPVPLGLLASALVDLQPADEEV